tara:strand:+ start:63 stop:434 length:372 start_codon:yes stop_codon:yes gene_type:complete
LIKKEKTWRLVKDIKKGKYCYLIGVNKWAIELKVEEFYSLYRLLTTIDNQLSLIKNELMDEELINLEIEQSPWYAELDGQIDEWNLRLVFESKEQTRSFEMYWPIPIAQTLFYEIKRMWESMN